MLPYFGFGNHKGEMLPFKAFRSMGNRGKRALHMRILLQIKCAEHLNLIHLFQWMALGLAWSGELMRRQKGNAENGKSILLTIPTKRCLASYSSSAQSIKNSRHLRVSGFQNPWIFCLWNPNSEKFCLWNLESWAFESGIQLKESRIPLTTEIQHPSSTDKDWNPESKTVLDSLTLGDSTLLTLFARSGSNAVLHINLTWCFKKMYSDSASVVATGIIISKYETKCFVSDSFLKISGCSNA